MCDVCGKTDTLREPRHRRLKIAEIDPQWHCAILGTCLTLGELESIAVKLGIKVDRGPGGYRLHAAMVQWASRDHAVGKALTKLLDRKHAPFVNRFAKIADGAALAELWAESLAKGEVAGACWAIMSHGAASEELKCVIFQEIHMLSHRVGAATRADLKLIRALETDKAELEAKVFRQQERLRHEIGARDAEIAELRQSLEIERAESRRLAYASVAAGELDDLRRVTSGLRLKLETDGERLRQVIDDRRGIVAETQTLREQLVRLAAENTRLTDESRACEARLEGQLAPPDCCATCDGDCGRFDLCGRCILFVGGFSQHLPHLKRLVEDSNGVFSHHDGGMEQNMARLHGLLGRADAVLFPVDCISHSAQDAVKQLCRRWRKPFVPVRRSGLGAYLLALNELAASGDEGRA